MHITTIKNKKKGEIDMEFKGSLTDAEVLKAIENNVMLRTMRTIVEDEDYDEKAKYVILEGMLSTWDE